MHKNPVHREKDPYKQHWYKEKVAQQTALVLRRGYPSKVAHIGKEAQETELVEGKRSLRSNKSAEINMPNKRYWYREKD